MLICQSPITIYVEGEAVKMPCGHCKYCLQQKANRYAQQISLEYLTSPAVLFCTLTYSPENLPQAKVKSSILNGYCHLSVEELNNFTYSAEYDKNLLGSHKLSKYDKQKNYQSGIVPVLCRSHVTRFIKRVRRHVQYNGLGKVRYYYCGEYGFKKGRPHYHALLFCQSQAQASQIEQSIHSLWKYGLVDVQRARTACSRYLGSYLSCSYSSPFGSRATAYPPFSSHSNRLGYKAVHIQYIDKIVRGYREHIDDFKTVFRIFCSPISNADGSISTLPLWSSYTNTLLPKCVGFSRFNRDICRRLYCISSELAKFFTDKERFITFWKDYNSGNVKSTYTLSQINLVDFVTFVYCATCKNLSIKDAIYNNNITPAILDKFTKWMDKVISTSKRYLAASQILGISTYQLCNVIRDFYDAQNFFSLHDQLSDFQETKFGYEEMVYTYCNLPHYPLYLHHSVPEIVISHRTQYEQQLQKSIFKKSHLF